MYFNVYIFFIAFDADAEAHASLVTRNEKLKKKLFCEGRNENEKYNTQQYDNSIYFHIASFSFNLVILVGVICIKMSET